MARKIGTKRLIRDFFTANLGRVVTSKELQAVAGVNVTEWARRVRDLRADGWTILTHNDSVALKPGQYRVDEIPVTNPNVKVSRKISAKLRAEVLDRNGFTCQMCGLTPGDIDPDTNRKVRLHLGHIVDKSLGGKDELANLRALCSTCNQGAKNITSVKPPEIWLLSQIRRAGIDEQRAVFTWLAKKFGT